MLVQPIALSIPDVPTALSTREHPTGHKIEVGTHRTHTLPVGQTLLPKMEFNDVAPKTATPRRKNAKPPATRGENYVMTSPRDSDFSQTPRAGQAISLHLLCRHQVFSISQFVRFPQSSHFRRRSTEVFVCDSGQCITTAEQYASDVQRTLPSLHQLDQH